MTRKKDVKQIKIELKGELKTLVENEADQEFRTCTQQVYYILNKYYKEGFGTQTVKIGKNEELLGTNSEYIEPVVNSGEDYIHSSSKNTNIDYEDDTNGDDDELYEDSIDSIVLDF